MKPRSRPRRRNSGSGTEFQASQTYLAWLRAKDFKVTSEELAMNTHMAHAAEPLERALDQFAHDYDLSWVMTREEVAVLHNAARILKTLSIPRAMLDVQEKKPILLRRPPR